MDIPDVNDGFFRYLQPENIRVMNESSRGNHLPCSISKQPISLSFVCVCFSLVYCKISSYVFSHHLQDRVRHRVYFHLRHDIHRELIHHLMKCHLRSNVVHRRGYLRERKNEVYEDLRFFIGFTFTLFNDFFDIIDGVIMLNIECQCSIIQSTNEDLHNSFGCSLRNRIRSTMDEQKNTSIKSFKFAKKNILK